MRIRIVSFLQETSRRLPAILSSLESVGLQVEHLEDRGAADVRVDTGDDPTQAASLLLLESVDERHFDQVRRAIGGASGRVLAITVQESPVSTASGWSLLAAGVDDVLTWENAARTSSAIRARLARWDEVDRRIAAEARVRGIVGDSRAWISCLRQVVESALFGEASVLLLGETGTGKDLLARWIHDLDGRASTGFFVVVDCTTLSPELAGSELFGHERGAFTGAASPRDGAFLRADGGTLFLDEVGELPLDIQARFLRAIQEGVFKRLGSDVWKPSRFRLVCATNRDLASDVREGRFRRDLYHRIAGSVHVVPPLRDRRADVEAIALSFLRESWPEASGPTLDGAVRCYLQDREYPGNVRDLRQLMARICSRHAGLGPITLGDIAPIDRPTDASVNAAWRRELLDPAIRAAITSGLTLQEIGRIASETALRLALEEADGRPATAAAKLGVSRRAVHLRLANSRRGGA